MSLKTKDHLGITSHSWSTYSEAIDHNDEVARVAIKELMPRLAHDRRRMSELEDENARLRAKLAAYERQRVRNDESNMVKILSRLDHIEEHIVAQEQVIVVREISFDDAYRAAKELIKNKDLVDPLELADELGIPYGQAHEIALKLRDEGLIEPNL